MFPDPDRRGSVSSEDFVPLLLDNGEGEYPSDVLSSLEQSSSPQLPTAGRSSSSLHCYFPVANTGHVSIPIGDASQPDYVELLTGLTVALGYVLRAQSRPNGPELEEMLCMSNLQTVLSEIFTSGSDLTLTSRDLETMLQSSLLDSLSGVQDLRERVELISLAFDEIHPGELFPLPQPTGSYVKRFFVKSYQFLRYSKVPFVRCFLRAFWIFFTHTCYEYFSYGCCVFLQRKGLDALTISERLLNAIRRYCNSNHP